MLTGCVFSRSETHIIKNISDQPVTVTIEEKPVTISRGGEISFSTIKNIVFVFSKKIYVLAEKYINPITLSKGK